MSSTINSSSSTVPSTSIRPQARPETAGAAEVAAAPPSDAVAISADAGGAAAPNPYEGFSEHSVSMKPDSWTKDRTPGEGQVARNDHLEGMLRNQGYSVEDIYKKDENGQNLLQRVADANGLKDPNLITPEQSLTLPTKNAPPADAETKADEVKGETVTTEAYNEGEGAKANASTEVGRAEDSTLTTSAETQGDGSEANASTKVGESENSTITTEAKAEGKEATANASTEVGKAKDSEITTVAAAEGEGSQANAGTAVGEAEKSKITTAAVATGDGAEANAGTTVGEAKESEVTTSAAAIGDGAQANAGTAVGTAEDSPVKTEAASEGEGSTAEAATSVAEAKDSTVETTAVAEGKDSQAVAIGEVAKAEDSTVASTAVSEGEGSNAGAGAFVTGAEGSTLEASASSDGGSAEAYVDNSGYDQNGRAEVSAAGADGAHAEATGVEHASVAANGGAGNADVVVDAKTSETAVTGEGDGTVVNQGRDSKGSFDIDVAGDARILDEGNDPTMSGTSTGNSIEASARGEDLEVRTSDSKSVDIAFEGREGDNFVRGNLPQGGESSRVDLGLGDGNDRVEMQRGANDDTMIISKTDGELDLNLHTGVGMDDNGSQTTLVDGGNAKISGSIGGSEGDDTVMIQGGDFGDLKVSGGTGGNDQLVIDLPEGAAIPAIVTKEADSGWFGWGATEAEGILPEGYKEGDQAISANGFENIVIRQGGKVVGQYGEGELPPEFQQAVEQARS